MNCIRLKMWKNDLKILGNALIKSLKNLFAAKIRCVSNNKKLFPLHTERQKEPLLISYQKLKRVYYDYNAILSEYAELSALERNK